MGVNLVSIPEAEQDISEAYGWYEKQRPGLGEEFLSCVDACVQRVCRAPEMHAKVFQGFHRALTRRFPYAIFYEYAHNTVTIFCVFHTARDPEKWRQRLN